jgi:hypothetical protein
MDGQESSPMADPWHTVDKAPLFDRDSFFSALFFLPNAAAFNKAAAAPYFLLSFQIAAVCICHTRTSEKLSN